MTTESGAGTSAAGPTEEELAGRFRDAVDDMLDLFDGLTGISIGQAKVRNFQLLHGLVAQCVNSSRAALRLIDQGLVAESAPLVRVALEHAAFVQWIRIHPAGIDEYISEATHQSSTFHATVVEAKHGIPADVQEYYRTAVEPKRSPTMREVKKLMSDLDPTGFLYIQYKYLCGFVHPSAATTVRFLDGRTDPPGLLTHPAMDPLPLLATLAQSDVAALGAFLDLIKGKPHKARIRKVADSVGLRMWFTADGKVPKTRF